MNELNQLEKRLRSWTPRPPSPNIKRRLFAQAQSAALETSMPNPIGWRWLTPALAACAAALIVLVKIYSGGFAGATGPRFAPTFALSNLDFSTFYAAAGQGDHNIVQTTFKWTNGAYSTTTAPSVFDRIGY